MDRAAIQDWWGSRGAERLALLLWALWNPIGPVPLDEYEGYIGPVTTILEKARSADAQLAAGSDDDETQRKRNRLHAAAVDELAAHLAQVRETRMAVSLNPAVERNAAEVLLQWYELEMELLERKW